MHRFLTVCLLFVFLSCARQPNVVLNDTPAGETGLDRDEVVWTVENQNSQDVNVKIDARDTCGNSRSYLEKMTQVVSFTSKTDTVHLPPDQTLCAVVQTDNTSFHVPAQFARFSTGGLNFLFMTVENDLDLSSLWIR